MSKFRNNSEEKGRSRGTSRPGKASSEDRNKKPKSYKAKRSFTKNKDFRDTKKKEGFRREPDGPGAERRFKKPFDKERSSDYKDRPKKSFEDKKPSYGKDKYGDKPRKSYDSGKRKSYREDKGERSFEKRDDKKPFKSDRAFKPKEDKFSGFKKAPRKSESDSRSDSGGADKKRRFTKPRKYQDDDGERRVKHDEFEEGKAFSKNKIREGKKPVKSAPNPDGLIRLNKYLSNAGVASRREADNLILSGTVKVNDVVVDQLGYKIKPTDKVSYGDAAVKTERKVYLLLNKPKDYITTVDDPKDRKTVMELIQGACRERIYPVGRLDRNTTGLLLFTNDGELTTKLTHPKHGIKKVYHVTLNKGLKIDDFKAIVEGIELEDGPVKADDLAFVGEGKKEVGIEIHSGRNRIVRRIFEQLGYDVLKLDRVVFAGLTKKDLPRGKHRFLTAKEISFLQMIG
jgi:23S rRNA pseudouridine2605 synthase